MVGKLAAETGATTKPSVKIDSKHATVLVCVSTFMLPSVSRAKLAARAISLVAIEEKKCCKFHDLHRAPVVGRGVDQCDLIQSLMMAKD